LLYIFYILYTCLVCFVLSTYQTSLDVRCMNIFILYMVMGTGGDESRPSLISRYIITVTRTKVSAHPRYVISRTWDILVPHTATLFYPQCHYNIISRTSPWCPPIPSQWRQSLALWHHPSSPLVTSLS